MNEISNRRSQFSLFDGPESIEEVDVGQSKRNDKSCAVHWANPLKLFDLNFQ